MKEQWNATADDGSNRSTGHHVGEVVPVRSDARVARGDAEREPRRPDERRESIAAHARDHATCGREPERLDDVASGERMKRTGLGDHGRTRLVVGDGMDIRTRTERNGLEYLGNEHRRDTGLGDCHDIDENLVATAVLGGGEDRQPRGAERSHSERERVARDVRRSRIGMSQPGPDPVVDRVDLTGRAPIAPATRAGFEIVAHQPKADDDTGQHPSDRQLDPQVVLKLDGGSDAFVCATLSRGRDGHEPQARCDHQPPTATRYNPGPPRHLHERTLVAREVGDVRRCAKRVPSRATP